MASGKDVKAGGAYVEISARSEKLQAGLKAAKKRLDDFGKSVKDVGTGVMDVGVKMAAFGAAITGVAAASVLAYTKIAGDFADLAAQTGLTVELMSELETALKDSGTTVEAFAKNVVKMQKAIFEAASGSKAASETFAALGLDVAKLMAMSPDDQFVAIAEALSKVQNPTQRLGFALEIFGKSAEKLMPILSGGASGIAAFRAEAQRLGLSLSGDAAEAADALGTQIEILQDQTIRIAVAIGEALAPAARDLVAALQGVVGSVVNWIKSNRDSIPVVVGWAAAIGTVGAVIAGVGVGIIALGAVITGLGTIVGALSAVIGFLGAAWGVVAAAATAAWGAMLSPVGLVIAGVVALVGVIAYFTGALGAAASFVGQAFGAMGAVVGDTVETIKSSMGGIVDALASGNIELAGQIAMKGLEVAFREGLAKIYSDVVMPFVKGVGDLMSYIPGLGGAASALSIGAAVVGVSAGATGDARKELDDLIKQAKDLRGLQQGPGRVAPVMSPLGTPEIPAVPDMVIPDVVIPDVVVPKLDAQANEVNRRMSAIGGFNATALSGVVGQVDAQDQIAKNTAAMLEQLKNIFREVRDGGLVFA